MSEGKLFTSERNDAPAITPGRFASVARLREGRMSILPLDTAGREAAAQRRTLFVACLGGRGTPRSAVDARKAPVSPNGHGPSGHLSVAASARGPSLFAAKQEKAFSLVFPPSPPSLPQRAFPSGTCGSDLPYLLSYYVKLVLAGPGRAPRSWSAAAPAGHTSRNALTHLWSLSRGGVYSTAQTLPEIWPGMRVFYFWKKQTARAARAARPSVNGKPALFPRSDRPYGWKCTVFQTEILYKG